MKHITLRLAIVGMVLCFSAIHSVNAYEVKDYMLPTNLTIMIDTSTQPEHNNFTRYLAFRNLAGNYKRVAVAFHNAGELRYAGEVTPEGLATLQSFVTRNNRSYWDTVFFENQGGSTALPIRSMAVEIEYANTCCSREQTATIAYAANVNLGSGDDSFRLSNSEGRRRYAIDFFNWSDGDFYALPPMLKQMIFDIGKSGSSGSADSIYPFNPKYAQLDASALCSETISWYYYLNGVHLQDTATGAMYNFKNVTAHTEMHDAFKNSDRLYCYHTSRQQWIMKDRDYNWVYEHTYEPQPGDYLDRRDSDASTPGDDGHAMMMVEWYGGSEQSAYVIDGPYNINFRPIDVLSQEQNGTDYCVGRIPAND